MSGGDRLGSHGGLYTSNSTGLADRFKNLTLNMKDLEYISSSGLRSIRNLYIKVNQNGGKLVLTNVNENVMEVFEMTGLAGLLNIR